MTQLTEEQVVKAFNSFITKGITEVKGTGKNDAKIMLKDRGVPMGDDFHRLSSSDVEKVLDAAKEYGYKKSRNANGSTARSFYEFANK